MIPASGTPAKDIKDFGFVCDDMVERYPEGLVKILAYLRRKFRLPIYITEHGAASDNEPFRELDLRQNLEALHRSMSAGVDVRGFFYWSLMDNFEWQFGYTKKFGLLKVDFADANLPRTKKPLADVYSQICRENLVKIAATP
jgi:beta-glucosidase